MLACAGGEVHRMRYSLLRQGSLILIGLFAGAAAAPLVQGSGGTHGPSVTLAAVKTGKERLSDKASDEQRVDDCKVDGARRTKPRPASCRGNH